MSETLAISDIELFYESSRSRIYKGLSNSGETILLKNDLTGDISRLYNEASITNKSQFLPLNSNVILHEGQPVIVRKYIPGKSLKNIIPKQGLYLRDFLPLAINISKELQEIHNRGLLHNDINPNNFIIDVNTKEAKLIDYEFGSSAEIQELLFQQNINLSGTVEYISPEQTGRMNRRSDHRSDLYSLGATFYEMLTGRTPFVDKDFLALIHCHLAILPKAPSEFNKNIPRSIDQIVLKLLSKNAEDRYQSIAGILADLNFCLDNISDLTDEIDFHAGRLDISSKLMVSQRLYGREDQIKSLEMAYDLARSGKKVLFSINGNSGIGKSVVCQELHKRMSAKNSFFLSGSFDVMDRQTPYLAFSRAFTQFSDWLISEDQETQDYWRLKLKQSLKGFEKILIDLAPNLGHILKNQATLLPLKGLENQQRMQFAINSFLEALSTEDNPLVLFLDDYQWANEASVELLKAILKNSNLQNILLLITYRDGEVDMAHPLQKTLNSIREEKGNKDLLELVETKLSPLKIEHVRELISDTLKLETKKISDFAELIYSKTKGNPFAINKLLESLYQQKLLFFDYPSNSWKWDMEQLKNQNLSENIIEILLLKINEIEKNALSVIKIASVFGLEFTLEQLKLISNLSQTEIHYLLWPLIQEGSIIPLSNDYLFIPEFYEEKGRDISFRFSHARIQQAVYSLLDHAEKEKFHFEVGQILLEKLNKKELEEKSIEICVHLDLGRKFIQKANDQESIGRLLLNAGEKSANTAAFESAFKFLSLGIEVLDYKLSISEKFQINLNLLEYTFLIEDKEKRHLIEPRAFALSQTKAERLLVYEIIVRCLPLNNLPQKAIEATRKGLLEVGIRVPLKASIPQVIFQLIKMRIKLPPKKFGELSKLPAPEDPYVLALFKLLYASLPSYLFVNPNTYPIIIVKILELTLKYGLAPESVPGIASYGLILITAMKQPEEGYDIIEEALKLEEHPNNRKFTATVHMVYGVFSGYLKNNNQDTFPYFEDGYQKGVQYGNMEYASWNLFWIATLSFHLTSNMEKALEHIIASRRFAMQYKISNQSSAMEILEKVVETMISEERKLEGKLIDLRENKPKELEIAYSENNEVYLYTYFGYLGNIHLWFNENEEAFDLFEEYSKHTKEQPINFVIVYERFNRALNAAFLAKKYNSFIYKNVNLKKIIKKEISSLKRNAKLNPDSFNPFWEFLETQIEIIENKPLDRERIERCIQGLEKVGMPKWQVLFYEAYSDDLKSIDKKEFETFRNKAIDIANELGSPAKVRQLLGLGILTKNIVISTDQNKSHAISSSIEISSIDTMTLIKSMEALVTEIKLDRILEKLLTYAMENTGAQEGHFLINSSDGWIIEVSTKSDHELHTTFPKIKYLDTDEVSRSIINFAKGTKDPVLIDDALHTSPFDGDATVLKKNIRSVLCIPFINQSKNSGIIYLTHSNNSSAFKKEHISLMRLMAGQIAGIIENALLYQNMENLVKERTKQLEVEKQKSDDLLLNILPQEIANELIDNGHAAARHHEEVSVMFIDIKDFTYIAQRMTPDELVKNLHQFFGKFDEIMEEFGLEKIKTIGDAYMAAGGVPSHSEDHPKKIILAAKKILDEMNKANSNKIKEQRPIFQIRIGIHVGPVVAGVVGNKKFAYDIWGDTVNIASRMESSSDAGKINISHDLYEQIKDDFDCEYRGEIEVKNKGMMKMYFVHHS